MHIGVPFLKPSGSRLNCVGLRMALAMMGRLAMNRRIMLLLLAVVSTAGLLTITVVVVRSTMARNQPIEVIKHWAAAAEHGDTSRARELMEPNEVSFVIWRDWWHQAQEVYDVRPGYVVNGATVHGDTTRAIVHFRTPTGALCVPVAVDQQGKLALAGGHYACALPMDGVR
jgi:hypothetical protein